MAGLFNYKRIISSSDCIINHTTEVDDPNIDEFYEGLEQFMRNKMFDEMTRLNIRYIDYLLRPSGRPETIVDALYCHDTTIMLIYPRADILNIIRKYNNGLEKLDEFMTQMSFEYIKYFDEHCDIDDRFVEDNLSMMKSIMGVDNNDR